jgi:hypothetical protein
MAKLSRMPDQKSADAAGRTSFGDMDTSATGIAVGAGATDTGTGR